MWHGLSTSLNLHRLCKPKWCKRFFLRVPSVKANRAQKATRSSSPVVWCTQLMQRLESLDRVAVRMRRQERWQGMKSAANSDTNCPGSLNQMVKDNPNIPQATRSMYRRHLSLDS